MLGAAQSLLVVQALFLVHGHPVADAPGVHCSLCVLELCDLGMWGVAISLKTRVGLFCTRLGLVPGSGCRVSLKLPCGSCWRSRIALKHQRGSFL